MIAAPARTGNASTMRTSGILLATEREDPSDAEIVSHRLMIRAGLVRRLAAGLYTWLPLGLRVLRKIENIVREEMDRAGAQEVLMPAVQPAELWMESGRWDHFGPELLRLRDRHEREFCVGPTHEEVITDIVRREVRSYRQLPLNLYQIQTKFRDEVRPRFGVMRAREFIMKDAYSFDLDEAGSRRSYETMRDAYRRIFSRTGLDFRVVEADSGAIGGSRSEEFHVLADSGEDDIAFNDEGTYAANLELTPAPSPPAPPAATETMREVKTPDVRTIEDVSELLGVPPERCLKTLFVEGEDGPIALVLRGDHELNLVKASRLEGVRTPVALASPEAVREATGAGAGSVGPIGLGVPVVVDHWAAAAADFVCGANRDDAHLAGVNWGRDLPRPATADLRNAIEGDPSPDGRGTISIRRGIEVGHVFQLGRKYSESMHAVCLDEGGRARTLEMGCYGIGVSRIAAAAIEQNHDENGIVWPDAIAPFEVALLPLNSHRSGRVRDRSEALYEELRAVGVEVLLDDRAVRPGVMFSEMDLIGIPHRLVLGERRLDEGTIEYRNRRDGETEFLPLDEAAALVAARIDRRPA